MAKLTVREELIALSASICVAVVLVVAIAGMTLANTVHQSHPTPIAGVSGLSAKAQGKT
jgi:hypothetical protein